MRDMESWMQLLVGKSDQDKATVILTDLIGYVKNSKYRVEDTDNLRNAIIAIRALDTQRRAQP